MTLDKHTIQGLPAFTTKTLPSSEFEKRMINVGYYEVGTAPAQGGRIKIWWSHAEYPTVESIYSPDKNIVLTAYSTSYSDEVQNCITRCRGTALPCPYRCTSLGRETLYHV
jgi:hypothetical protein